MDWEIVIDIYTYIYIHCVHVCEVASVVSNSVGFPRGTNGKEPAYQ